MFDAKSQLSDMEKKEVISLVGGNLQFVDNDVFHRKDAESYLFTGDEEVPQIDTSWFSQYTASIDGLPLDENTSLKAGSLLTKQDEISWFLRFNYARYRRSQLSESICKKGFLSNTDARDLLHWHRLALSIRSMLVNVNLRMAIRIAKNKKQSKSISNDLISVGGMKLINAVDGFDVRRGFKFSTYAYWAIFRALLREFTTEGKHRHKIISETDTESGEIFEPPIEDKTEMLLDVEALRHILTKNLAGLNKKERYVIEMRFLKFQPDGSRYFFKDLAVLMDISGAYVQIIEGRAIDKLRKVWQRLLG